MPDHKLVNYTYTSPAGVAKFEIDHEKEYQVESCKSLFLSGFANVFNCEAKGNVLCIDGFSDFTYLSAGGADKPYANLSATLAIDSIVVGKTFKLENIY